MGLYCFFSAMKWFIQLMEIALVVNEDNSSG